MGMACELFGVDVLGIMGLYIAMGLVGIIVLFS